jgi:UDP-N-acetylmuramoylalanine--D-glutamate ligase
MRVAIAGYGKSGKSAEKILRCRGVDNIEIYDDNLFGTKKIDEMKKSTFDCIVLSPGIDYKKYSLVSKNIISEIDLAYTLVNDPDKMIAITGSNGKSTTTYLLAQIINRLGKKAVACGNIGQPFTDVAIENDYDYYVVELSSFQIELLKLFKAKRLIVTNISTNHLDRYTIYEEYIEAKLGIVNRIIKNGYIVSVMDPILQQYILPYKGRITSIDTTLDGFPKLIKNNLYFGDKFYCDIEKFPLFGKHNLYNLIYALLVADDIFNLKGDVSYLLEDLKGLDHRSEVIDNINGIQFINDSKSTTIASTEALLSSLGRKCILILGGKDKGDNFSKLENVVKTYVATLILYGQAASKIYKELGETLDIPVYLFEHLKEATIKAYECANSVKLVIFSPACSSYDAFKNFEERGEYFKAVVRDLKNECA